jgi:DUF1680 family protein
MQSKNEIVVNIYTSSTTEILINNVKVKICQTTEYPKNGKINLLIDPDNNISFRLLLRKPEWCKNAKIFKDGKRLKYEIKNGYMVLDNQWKETGENVSVELEMEPFFVHATIANTERVAIKYGPLVLAIDNRFQTPINGTKIKCSKRPVLNALSTENEFIPIVKFSIDGEINGKCDKVTLVDYASAGSLNPNIDKFRIWIPTLK